MNHVWDLRFTLREHDFPHVSDIEHSAPVGGTDGAGGHFKGSLPNASFLLTFHSTSSSAETRKISLTSTKPTLGCDEN